MTNTMISELKTKKSNLSVISDGHQFIRLQIKKIQRFPGHIIGLKFIGLVLFKTMDFLLSD